MLIAISSTFQRWVYLAKIVLFALFLIVLSTYPVFGQSSTAVMRVRVNVVIGNSIEIDEPRVAVLSESSESTLGNLELKGLNRESALITFSKRVILTNKKGNKIKLDIRSQKRHSKDSSTKISFKGSSTEKMKSGIYSGELKTTIQYL